MTINRIISFPETKSDKEYIQKYIDHCVIDDYADKDFNFGYSLQVCNLPINEKRNITLMLLDKDEILKEKIEEYIQCLIDDRLNEVESVNRFYNQKD